MTNLEIQLKQNFGIKLNNWLYINSVFNQHRDYSSLLNKIKLYKAILVDKESIDSTGASPGVIQRIAQQTLPIYESPLMKKILKISHPLQTIGSLHKQLNYIVTPLQVSSNNLILYIK